ncbi:MAG: hypothetical protein ACOC5F_03315 [Candidatus Aminicenantaceae bacterium]
MSCKKKNAEKYYKEFKNFSIKIPWDCFVYILKNFLGFEMVKKSGSKRLFIKENKRFTVDEPHGRGDRYVDKFGRRRAITQIESLGIDIKKGETKE